MRLAYLDEQPLSGISRQLPVNTEYILDESRTLSGMLVRDYVAAKRTFEFNWEMLPWRDEDVPDRGKGAGFLASLDVDEVHTLRLYYGPGMYVDYQVMVTGLDYEPVDQDPGGVIWYSVRLTLAEV